MLGFPRLRRVLVAASLALLVALAGCRSEAPRADAGPHGTVRREAQTLLMDTECQLIVYAASAETGEAAIAAGLATLERVEGLLDRHNPESELSRVNAAAGDAEPVAISFETYEAIFKAQWLHHRTGGTFNPLVGPLVDVWKEAAKADRLPTEEAIAEAMPLLDRAAWDARWGSEGSFVHLKKPGMRLDLGGMAKGYAADRAIEAMRSAPGVRAALVNLGGDGACWCDAAWPRPWTFGIQDPEGAPGMPTLTLEVRTGAVVTSGHYYRSTTIAGREFSHILDPRTGWPAEPTVVSVTVVHPDGAWADGLATACAVLGPEAGLALLASDEQAEGLLMVEGDSGLEAVRTAGFERFLTSAETP